MHHTHVCLLKHQRTSHVYKPGSTPPTLSTQHSTCSQRQQRRFVNTSRQIQLGPLQVTTDPATVHHRASNQPPRRTQHTHATHTWTPQLHKPCTNTTGAHATVIHKAGSKHRHRPHAVCHPCTAAKCRTCRDDCIRSNTQPNRVPAHTPTAHSTALNMPPPPCTAD
jgi:hypothetical protein